MTAEGAAGLVEDERPFAFRAGLDVTAVAAEDDRCGAATVDRENRLLPRVGVEPAEGVDEAPREEPPVAGLELLSEVDDLDDGLGPGRSRRQLHPAVFPAPRPSDAVDRRRRAPENDGGAGPPGQLDRGIPRLEPRRAVAFVRALVLLVDDDDAEVRERCEHRQPRAHDDVDGARADPPPLIGSLTLAQRGVDQRDARAEIRPEPIDQRRGERNLWDEHERRPAAFEAGRDGIGVDRGLAATRD